MEYSNQSLLKTNVYILTVSFLWKVTARLGSLYILTVSFLWKMTAGLGWKGNVIVHFPEYYLLCVQA